MSSKSATVAKGIIIAAIPVILIVLFFRGLFSLASFKVTGNLSEDAKVSMAEQALLPDIAEYVDRYGLRGFQDVDLQIETVKFDSIDDLVKAFPYLSSYRSAQTHTGSDFKNKKVTIYEIESFKPSQDNTSSLPLDTSSIKPESQKKNRTWEYSIYEYSNGSCGFVILVMPH
ncbi:MAG: hypothetical protein Q4C15_05160 [Eubacteriales bacterium]|nr:hypothetical protein [Eubacteriales bacterium]